VQNSVFEGDLSESKLARMKSGLRKLLVDNHDSVIMWTARDNRWTDREILGTEKLPVSNIL
jgi:CRISPR-associated protein Cas2